MTVKRYGDTLIGIKEMDDGKWVSYEDYAALLKERDALAAENAGLRRFISGSCYVFDGDHDDDMPDEFVDASHYMPIVTPATDAAIANIRAREAKGIYESILDNPAVTDMGSLVDWIESYANNSISHAAQLRREAGNEQ